MSLVERQVSRNYWFKSYKLKDKIEMENDGAIIFKDLKLLILGIWSGNVIIK